VSDGLRERDQLEVEGRGLVLLGLLGSTPTSRTWLAADADGGFHVARRLSGRAEAEKPSILSALSRLARLHHRSLLAPDWAWVEGTAVWVIRPHDAGVSLRRLVAAAQLEPRHVAALGGDVLEGLAALHAVGVTHGALHPGNILVGLDGRARIADMELGMPSEGGGGTGGVDEVRPGRGPGDDVEATAAIIRSALTSLRRRGVSRAGELRRFEDLGLLGAVLGGPGPVFGGAGSADAARVVLGRAFGEPDARVRREIAALVIPLCPSRPIATPAPAFDPMPALRPEIDLPRPPRYARPSVVAVSGPRLRTWSVHLPPGWRLPSGRRLAAWLAPMTAVIVIVAAAVILSGRHPGAVSGPLLTTPVPSPTASVRSGTAPSSARASATASPVATSTPPAPLTAGAVAGLSASLVDSGGCAVAAGSSCEIRVDVHLEPAQAQTTVDVDLLLVDRCTGASSTISGGSVIADPGFDAVWVEASVVFPSGDAMTLYAVTSAPAQAASPGLTLPGSTSTC
jgi:hypothetical protein